MAFKMLRGSFFISTSLATFWIPVAQALYTLPLKNNTNASNHSTPLVEKRFPKTEDGRCGVDFGTSCENDECCSSQGYVIALNSARNFCAMLTSKLL